MGWHDVRIGLHISMVALFAGAGGLGLLMITTLSSGGSSASGAKFLMNMALWGLFLLLGSFFSMLTGFVVCLATPRRSSARGLAIGAVAALGVAIAMLIVVAPALGTMALGNLGSSQDPSGMFSAIKWLLLISSSAAMILYGYFASAAAREFGDPQCGTWAIGYTILEGLDFLWLVWVEVSDSPSSKGASMAMATLTFLLLIGSRVFLALIAQRARRPIQRALRAAAAKP